MKTNLKLFCTRFLLLVLVLALALTPLSACNGKESANTKKKKKKKATQKVETTSSETISEEEPVDNDEIEIIEDPENEPEEDITTKLEVQNAQQPIINTFRGSSGVVHFAYTFFNILGGAPKMTDAMAKTEFDRMQNAGYKYVRTIFKSSFAFDTKKQTWNWDSTNMNAVYKWARELQKRNMEVGLTTPWNLIEHATGKPSWVGDATYMHGYGQDLFGESVNAGIDFTGMTDDEIRLNKTAARVGHWVCEALQAFRQRGINNVTQLYCYTEPDGRYAKEYVTLVSRLHKTMVQRGIRHQYKLIGPNQAEYRDHREHMYDTLEAVLKHIKETGEPIVDILSAHQYPTGNDMVSDSYIAEMDSYTPLWMQLKEMYGFKGEFWMDEFNLKLAGTKDGDVETADQDYPWFGTWFAACMCRAMDYGISNTVIWNFSHHYWPGGSVFYANGLNPVINLKQEPYTRFYAYQMITRAFGYEGGKVYKTIDDPMSGIYAGCAQLKDGNWAVLAVNTNAEDFPISVQFEKSLGKNMYRHLYTPLFEKSLSDAQIPADKGFKNVKTVLNDVLPAGGVAIYTSVQYK